MDAELSDKKTESSGDGKSINKKMIFNLNLKPETVEDLSKFETKHNQKVSEIENVSVSSSSVKSEDSLCKSETEHSQEESCKTSEQATNITVNKEQEISSDKPKSETNSEVIVTDKQERREDSDDCSASEKQQSDNKESCDKQKSDEYSKYAEHVHYEDNVAIYTDPSTKYQYKWCGDKNEWVPRSTSTESQQQQYGYENDTHTYRDQDGTVYFWDEAKSAWFPKVDDDFLAVYQMSYGFTEQKADSNDDDKFKKPELPKAKPTEDKKRKAAEPPVWFEVDEHHNTKVYVSNLPLDIDEQEFLDTMQKCGLVEKDMATGKMKIKLYKEPNSDRLKGDGLCTYIKVESVELALKVLDGYDIRNKKIKVERAKFQMKGDMYDPKLKPKKKKKKEIEKIKKMQEKLFSWQPDKLRGERSKHERVVIIKNLFEPSVFDQEAGLVLEFQQDLREECSKCGDVRRVVVYDRHPEGVAQVTMADPEEADLVIQLLNKRWFNKRQITAETWDGKTKYKIHETDSEIEKRIDNWEKFLDEKDEETLKNPKGITNK